MRFIQTILALIREARPYRSVAGQIYDLVEHKLRINTSFRDYYRFGFYNSDESWDEKTLYIGPNGSRYWPHEGNSLKWERVFAVKSAQKSLLMGAGLPTPRMLLKAGSEYPINTREKLADAFREIAMPVICKFDGGGGGDEIYALEYDNGAFSYDGKPVDAEWIWDRYAGRMDRGFFVEERISNHPQLDELYPDALNTLRLITLKTADGKWHFLRPFLKIGRGGAHVDNMSAGGIFAGLDENGVADSGYCKRDDTEYERHPDTGARIKGFKVPHYQEALDLAVHASRTLGFMKTFGWDMAVTPDGPVLIEANPSWHFAAVQQRLGPLLNPEITKGLAPRAWYTPWDRTHNYPFYFRHSGGGPWQMMLAARRRYWNTKLGKQAKN